MVTPVTEVDKRLAYYRQFRSQILSDLADYEAGHRRTSESITDLKHRLAKTDQIIAGWGAMKNTSRSALST
jgi:hypothetical protein